MTKRFFNLSLIIIALILVYLAGPKPNHPNYTTAWPRVPYTSNALEAFITEKESYYTLRTDNEARIIWYDSLHSKTEYAVLYLHGFSASQGEGAPIHQRFAKSIGANLYLARLQGHGLDTAAQLSTFTAEGAWADAVEALAIADQLGKKVIIMSTSTGGTFALKLAADYPDKVYALINFSPNLALANPAGVLLNNHWGEQIATVVFGSQRYVEQKNGAGQYWDSLYTVSALVQLEELLETTMTEETFEKIKCPVLTLYYYKDETHYDEVVNVSLIPEMHSKFSTPASGNKYIALSTPENHVLASPYKSKDTEVVYDSLMAWWGDLEMF